MRLAWRPGLLTASSRTAARPAARAPGRARVGAAPVRAEPLLRRAGGTGRHLRRSADQTVTIPPERRGRHLSYLPSKKSFRLTCECLGE